MNGSDIRDKILAEGWKDKPVEEILEILNTPRIVLVERFIGIGAVLDTLGPEAGGVLLDGIYAMRESNPVVRWGWHLLEKGELDVGLASTRAMLDALLPEGAAQALKSLAEESVSAGVERQQVIDAMEGI